MALQALQRLLPWQMAASGVRECANFLRNAGKAASMTRSRTDKLML